MAVAGNPHATVGGIDEGHSSVKHVLTIQYSTTPPDVTRRRQKIDLLRSPVADRQLKNVDVVDKVVTHKSSHEYESDYSKLLG